MVNSDAGGSNAKDCRNRCSQSASCFYWDWDGSRYCRLRANDGGGSKDRAGYTGGSKNCQFQDELTKSPTTLSPTTALPTLSPTTREPTNIEVVLGQQNSNGCMAYLSRKECREYAIAEPGLKWMRAVIIIIFNFTVFPFELISVSL